MDSKKLAAGIVVVIAIVVVGMAAYLLTRQYSLTIHASPPNTGPVSLSSGENTSETITITNFSPGASVTLTATPAPGYIFDYWDGVSGVNASVTIVMNSNKVITANFTTPGD
jgi:hypothetical protein